MDSREKLKKLLVEWAEFEIPAGYQRDFDWRLMEGSEILSIIGARRTGKTYLCYQLMRKLRSTVPAGNVIYINFEDERLYPLKGDELSLLWEVCLEIFTIDQGKKTYLFVDEIQNIKNWSRWTRRITEQNQGLKLILTGSSSKLLSKEIATELRGRTISHRVLPLSFAEFLNARQVSVDFRNLAYSKERPLIKKHFNDFVSLGGFPAVLTSPNSRELLREYYNVMFYKDMAERHRIENLRMLEDYLTLLIDQTACSFSVSATAKKLNEFGHSFSKNTLSNFSRYAQDAFFVFEVKKYSYKIREQMRAPKKIYAIDHGLVQAVRFAFQENYGRMLENIVFVQLYRLRQEVYYHKVTRECDFITVDGGSVDSVFQVVKTMADRRTREREVEGVTEAMEYYNLKKGYILTDNDFENIKVKQREIEVLPIWYWLLAKP